MKDDTQFAFITQHPSIQCFDVATGERVSLDEQRRAQIRERALNDILPRLTSKDFDDRLSGVKLCGALKATQAIPELKKLLGDRTVTGSVGFPLWESSDLYGVRIAAAEVLISFLGTEVLPLIEEQLPDSPPATRDYLLRAIASLDGDMYFAFERPDSAYLLKTWQRLSQSEFKDVRKFALQAVLAREHAQYVYDRPSLLTDPDDNVRWHAVWLFANEGIDAPSRCCALRS